MKGRFRLWIRRWLIERVGLGKKDRFSISKGTAMPNKISKILVLVCLIANGCFQSDRKDVSGADAMTEDEIEDASVDIEINGSNTQKREAVESCTTDGDCPPDTVCIQGECSTPLPLDADVSKNGCFQDSDCDDQSRCIDGECVDRPLPTLVDSGRPKSNQPCESDDECGENESCYEGFCLVHLSTSTEGDPPAAEDVKCEQHSDCLLVGKNCCACGFSVEEYWALERGAAELYQEQCGDYICDCELRIGNPFIRAACLDGRCQAVDVSELPLVAGCSASSDCQVRSQSCCECEQDPSTTRLVAVSDPEAYRDLICLGTENCGICQPVYPEQVVAFCDRGLCKIADPR
jgi:hypothetical protein